MATLFPGVALVTGAGSGIGRACAVSFAREGCKKIVVADVSREGLFHTANEIKGLASQEDVTVLPVLIDISDPDSVQQMMERTIARLGRIDYAVNAAGIIGEAARSDEMSLQAFDRVVGVDYRGCWLCSRAELRQMLTQVPLPTHDGRAGNKGAIVNIASQLGIVARPNAAAYCSAKAAVIGMTKADAIDYSKDDIRINCVCPGVIETPMIDGLENLEASVAIAPMNRTGTPQEVADCVLFLCSSKASFVQGSALVVDGGYIIN